MTAKVKQIIKDRRKRFTQEAIAKKLGVSQQFLSQILNKKRPLPYRLKSKYNKIINSL